ncbi:Probable enoyl-CoA hydratase echA8 [uncultured Roseburia sp.]|uniref:Enoyl-CoA hydratase-related protein n=1 Tax=Brotonthovivens ammoniilytica TaxID=2981725 RepID=A0ABT2TJN4_9FIRM|nr:enoyl-CoA hydratase-related protein [Brotonthovivens ammoniilytica]MCU6762418.1 enoyl-CoA hydratase-related protein [Brotonthovivens ammoniilytica]SCI71040.1 Probable enoyl-CoA hydratase echA8 [uncultured Roseburia sp.]
MEYRSMILTKEDSIAIIQMNHPEAMNALEEELAAELLSAYKDVAEDPEIGAVILTGAGKAFCAGGDLKLLSRGFETAEAGYDYMKSFREMVTLFMNMPKPTIAAVNGFAVGAGFCIAMQADLILASDQAKFGMAFANVGLIPDLAGMYTLPRLVGLHRAKELVFTGRTISASEAEEMGIVNRVISHDELLAEAKKLAVKLAAGPRVALRMAKNVMNDSVNMTLEQLLDLEPHAQAICFQSEDHKIGVKAFFDKEKPVFKGK